MQLYCARQRRRLNRGLRRKQQSLLKRLRKAKKEAPPMEKPEVVKTHLRDMVILPEMVGSMVGVYNGKTFNQVEIKVRPRRTYSVFVSCLHMSNENSVCNGMQDLLPSLAHR
jgi:ribosomal protein uS19